MKNEHIISIDKSKCIKCNLCVNDCPVKVIGMTEDGAEMLSQACIKCCHCVAICPQNIISIDGFDDEPVDLKDINKVKAEDLLNHIKSRRSVRSFTSEKVDDESIKMLLSAGQYTPTAKNVQAVSYVVLTENSEKYENIAIDVFEEIKKASPAYSKMVLTPNILFKKAPLVIVVKANTVVDGTLAAASIENMAHALGLGAFYSGMFTISASRSEKLKTMLKVGEGEEIVATLVIGHPNVKYQRTAPKETPIVIFD